LIIFRIGEKTKEYHAKHGHPRGMLNKKHTIETKIRISETSKNRWENMTTEQYNEYRKRASNISRNNQTRNRSHCSWKSGYRTVSGESIYFRSSWEANYARFLDEMKKCGFIKERKHEVDAFAFNKIDDGVVSYLPDFEVTTNSGEVEYHEVKGWMDDRSIKCLEKMASEYPYVILDVVDGCLYRKLSSIGKFHIGDW